MILLDLQTEGKQGVDIDLYVVEGKGLHHVHVFSVVQSSDFEM